MASKPPIQPDEPGSGKGALVATVGTAAAAAILAILMPWEGKRNDPYYDIVHVQTVCYGETRVKMKHYTDAECVDMLGNSASNYAKGVLERNPELRARPYQLAAASSLTYNIGLTNYRGSTVAKRFSAHDWRGGCAAIMSWDKVRQGGKLVASPGLHNRRAAEYAVCLKGL